MSPVQYAYSTVGGGSQALIARCFQDKGLVLCERITVPPETGTTPQLPVVS